MSKGSRSRPVDKKKFDKNFDKIFGKKEKETTITVSVFGTEAHGSTAPSVTISNIQESK